MPCAHYATIQATPTPNGVELAAIERWLAAARAKRAKEDAGNRQRPVLDEVEASRGQCRRTPVKRVHS